MLYLDSQYDGLHREESSRFSALTNLSEVGGMRIFETVNQSSDQSSDLSSKENSTEQQISNAYKSAQTSFQNNKELPTESEFIINLVIGNKNMSDLITDDERDANLSV